MNLKPWKFSLLNHLMKENIINIYYCTIWLLSQPYPWACNQGKGLQGYGPREKPRSHTTCFRECRKCEGMNPHTPKGASTLGVGVPVDSRIFRKRLQGSKLNGLRSSLYHWKALGMKMSKMGLHELFGHLKQKKGRESNWQFDFRPLKVRNHPNFLACR